MKNLWENPEIQQLNRLPMRSPLIPFDSPENAQTYVLQGPEHTDIQNSPYTKSLDSTWKFALMHTPGADTAKPYLNWHYTTFDDSQWQSIQVPGTWTLQGFDHPHYTNTQMPFDILPPNVPEENPTGLYRLSVSIKKEWQFRRIILHIGSAESCTLVFVNGDFIGASKDTRLPCEFDITSSIVWSETEGTALIALKVIRYSDASFVEDQDQWWFGGIHRSVYLYATEHTYIQDIQAMSYYDPAEKTPTGIIPLTVTMGYTTQNDESFKLLNGMMDSMPFIMSYTVHSLEGSPQQLTIQKEVASGTLTGTFNYRQTLNQIRTTISISKAQLWNNEHPHLYLVTVSLYEPSDTTEQNRHIESTAFLTGFKSVAITNRELRFNNKMVYIHGVNRHEHNPKHGKTLSTAQMVAEIQLLKQYNFNAVRTSHYPDDERWYDLCDRYGIYLLDEANIENHAYYDCLARSDEWANAYMQRVQRMVRRDKNHVSIFGWSLGNESGDGQNQVACAAWIRRVDTTRIVHYEGFVRAEWKQSDFSLQTLARGKGLTDLISPMYPSIELITQYADTCDDYRPLIMCEYSHAMGNASGSLGDYWRAIESHHGLQGGFIWDWVDQGLEATAPQGGVGEPQGGTYWKYGGDYGDTPTDYDFCLNGLLFPDLTPKPAMEECRTLFAPVRMYALHPEQGLFIVENRFDFSSLDCLSLCWSIQKNGVSVKTGVVKLPAIAPNQKTQIKCTWAQTAIHHNSEDEVIFHADFIYNEKQPWMSSEEESPVCGRYEYYIHRAASLIPIAPKAAPVLPAPHEEEPSVPAKQQIIELFKPVIFRPLLENEVIKHLIGKEVKQPAQEWLDADLAHAVIQKEDGKFTLSCGPHAIDSMQGKKLATLSFKNRVSTIYNKHRAIKLDCTFTLTSTVSEYPRVGICFPISADFDSITWYGRGPQECYSDRKEGACMGLYTKALAELEVPYIVPQENGNRCDTRYIALSGKNTPDIHIQSDTPFSFAVSKYAQDDVWKCHHISELTDVTKGPDGKWYVTIDIAHRGVGTAACGPDTLEQYRIRPGVYTITLFIF
ncbi:MAG: DUF4981 domain-containing protein [Treponema sp.]|nr:DUF4981 domain-containing protein [Treponema sp.]